MVNNTENKGMAGFAEATCSVLFCAFSFIFLLLWQNDLLAVAQHFYSDGQTVYAPRIGAIIIVAVLWLLQVLVMRISRNGLGRIPALTWLPSAFVLTTLTAVREMPGGGMTYGFWPFGLLLLLAAFALAAWLGRPFWQAVAQAWQQRSSITTLLGNLFILLLTLLFVCAGCNSDRVFHARIHVERCLEAGLLDKAAATLDRTADTDSSLTMLTAYTLARQGKLGDRLFCYPIVGSTAALYPNGSQTRLAILPEETFYRSFSTHKVVRRAEPEVFVEQLVSRQLASKQAIDYLLCSHLLKRDLDAFAEALPQYYAINDSLPLHYREALTLYVHSRSTPKYLYTNSVMDADYEDFQHFGADIKDERARRNALRGAYGNTYWFYYENAESTKKVR